MGGNIPLGYDVRDRKLVVNAEEADTVVASLTRFVEVGSATVLARELRIRRVAQQKGHLD